MSRIPAAALCARNTTIADQPSTSISVGADKREDSHESTSNVDVFSNDKDLKAVETALEAFKQKLLQRNEDQSQQVRELQEQHAQKEIEEARLRLELKTLRHEHEELRRQVREVEEQKAQADGKIVDLEEQGHRDAEEMRTLGGYLKEREKQVNGLEQAKGQLEESLENANKSNIGLMKQAKSLNAQWTKLLRTANEQTELKLNEEKRRHGDLKRKFDELEERNEVAMCALDPDREKKER